MEQPANSIHDTGSLPEINLHVALFLEPFGTAARVTQVLRSIAAGLHFQADRSALERCANFDHPLTMGMVQGFGDAQQRS